MRGLDLSSWQSALTTVIGLALFALIGVGIRLVTMMTFQQRQQRANRQINERLKTLMAAYKVLGGSFTGNLAVDPRHMRDLRAAGMAGAGGAAVPSVDGSEGSDRARRIRDAVEAALSDIILLGTDEQVRLAQAAAVELVEGRPVHTDALVVSLRDFIRKALDLEPIPAGLAIPRQGPTRPSGAGGRGGGGEGRGGGGGGGNGGGGGGMGSGMGGGGMGGGVGASGDEANAGPGPSRP
ncbi:hypothetical protein MMB232_00841 [Brevundimonas subvibrioides]|uniref:hypothetical protein n=1 Tax=Brevundimonas subvibrioides TaxID=74313 RepID=UPI0032D592C2